MAGKNNDGNAGLRRLILDRCVEKAEEEHRNTGGKAQSDRQPKTQKHIFIIIRHA